MINLHSCPACGVFGHRRRRRDRAARAAADRALVAFHSQLAADVRGEHKRRALLAAYGGPPWQSAMMEQLLAAREAGQGVLVAVPPQHPMVRGTNFAVQAAGITWSQR